jgi:hypothetical protein
MAFRLHDNLAEVSVGTLSRIGLVVLIPILMVFALLTPQLAPALRVELPLVDHAQITVMTPKDNSTSQDARDQEKNDGDGPVDLYGNEVTDAVAKYKFDATGSLYETHSPQTELPRLASPKS